MVCGNILGLRGGHHEDDVAGRLFQRFQQRIEGRVGDLVGFVENVDFEAVARRTVARGLAQFADLVDAAIGGGVDFDHVHRVAGANLGAGIANAAGLGHRLVGRAAVQRHGQDARDRRLADAAMSAEDVAVRDALLRDGILQRAGDVFLADHVGEFLRPVFARQDLVAHAETLIIQSHARAGCRHGHLDLSRSDRPQLGAGIAHGRGIRRGRLMHRVLPRRLEKTLMQLRMSTRSMEGVLVVDCSGRVVFGEESASLRDTVKKLLAQSPKVVMNLREVNYIDSGGLGTLVSLYTTARNAGGAVKLARLSQRVGDLLQITKLLTVFEVFDDEEAAAR